MRIKDYINRNRESAWSLGILVNGFNDLLENRIQWINNSKYKNKWFADPFILDYNEKFIYVLVEEYDYSINRGRLAKITIKKSNWSIVDCIILLDLPTHLSFPAIYRINDRIYVAPENNCGNTFDIYELDNKSNRLIKIKQLLNKPLTDAIIIRHEEIFYLLTTYEPTPNGNHLTIYKSTDFFGPFSYSETLNFDENIARNAGAIFIHAGKIIRPAQESNYSYGHSLDFQELNIKDGKVILNSIDRIYSTNKKYSLGIHTYNEYNGLGIIDVKGHRNRLIGMAFSFVQNLLISLGVKQRKLLS